MAADLRGVTEYQLSGMELSLGEAAVAMGGDLSGESAARIRPKGVSIDSRSIRAGELFFAVEGPRFDGHEFVADAFGSGACCAVVRRDRAAEGAGRPVIAVGDTVAALQALAAHYRNLLDCTVIGVTGSNGKTTTKDLVAHVLAGTRLVGGTQGNLNNYLGVPLTLLSLRRDHRAAVVEMGASRVGEISTLARMARPRIGVITNVGPTHLEEMGSVENVAKTKAELASELSRGGTLVVNGDDDLLLSAVERALRPDVGLITCGFGPRCRIRAAASKLGPNKTEFEVSGWGAVTVPALGAHNVYNALMALAVGHELGIPFEDMRDRLAAFEPPAMRLRAVRAGGLVILNDTYNSNPASARAALDALKGYPCTGRRVAVLGDMLELGEGSARLHRELGAEASFVDLLLTLGRWAEDVVAAAVAGGLDPKAAIAFTDKEGLATALLEALRQGDVVLIKASRAIGMEEVAQALEGRFPKGS
jgi:UDP-N-acetylmuramoyl-tripeptide--D-alanyl-D-alanine ligase